VVGLNPVSSTLIIYQSGEVKSMSRSTHLVLGSTPVSGSTTNEVRFEESNPKREEGLASGGSRFPFLHSSNIHEWSGFVKRFYEHLYSLFD
jgi:hypothetical protein